MQKVIEKVIKKIFGNTTGRWIISHIKSKEERELIRKRRNFHLQFLNPNDIYFDIGANYGNRIEPIVNDGITIVAVEPQLPCVQYLRRKYKHKITIVPKGIGATKGRKTMYMYISNTNNINTLSSFSKDWINSVIKSNRFSNYTWDQQQVIEMETLDHLIAKYGTPQFIKIDVEGYEHEVLKGLSKPVNMISFEYTLPEEESNLIKCIDRVAHIAKHNKVLFNYSTGESMKLELDEWTSKEKIKDEIKSDFGDVYVKTIVC